jgi:hypothetical protein
MQRLNRDTISRTIGELIGETPDQTKDKFESERVKNETTKAKLRIPEHQRYYVWPESHKSHLIDSVMENCPLPLMVFTQHIKDGRVVWFIQDGQQRLTTLQHFILGKFPWKNKYERDVNGNSTEKYYNDLSSEEKRLFLSYKINCEIIDEPTPDQVSDIFERLNCGKPLTDNDKFFNRRDSPVISFILNELIEHKDLKDSFRKLTGLNVASKTRVQLGDIVGAVVAILTNSVQCIRTSFDRIGQNLYIELSQENKQLVIDVFKYYFKIVKIALTNAHITKPKKCYLKLSGMLGIWLFWRIDPEFYEMEKDNMLLLRKSCNIWFWFAKEIQEGDRKKEIFESLSAGHQRNIDVEALRARTTHLMENVNINDGPAQINMSDDNQSVCSNESNDTLVDNGDEDEDDDEEEEL